MITKTKFRLKTMLALIIVLPLVACTDSVSKPATSSEAQELGQVVPVEGGGQYMDLSAQELKGMMEMEDFFFANVHVPFEGGIPSTDVYIPFDQIEQKLIEFPQDKDAKVVLYCRSGSMSAIAARALVTAGYTHVYNLDGGFRAWAALGYELTQ